jgi:hypothetical protein
MKYKIGDKVKIISCIEKRYLNKTGEIICNIGELFQLRLDERKRK